MLDIYRGLPGVVYAEPNYVARSHLSANDPFFAQQWALSRTSAPEGWAIFPGSFVSAGAPIAFVDSGVEASHPDLGGRVVLGANCLTSICAPGGASDENGHGTLGAGIAAAAANNGIGLAGLSFGSAIIPVKALDASGIGTYSAIAAGVIWAADNGARVVNLSLAGTASSRTLCDAATYAIGKGALVTAAAGNFGSAVPVYPAACPGVVGVAATGTDDSLAPFSNFGAPDVFVAAPGVQIHTTYLNGMYALATGTSISNAFVSGLAALVIGQQPGRSVAEVKRILAQSSDKVGTATYGGDPYGTCAGCTWSTTHGYGRVNVLRALSSGAQASEEPAPPAQTPAEPSAPSPDFAISAAPAGLSVVRGTSASTTVSIAGSGGFAAPVALSATGLPAGAVATFAPASVPAPGSSTLTVTTSSTTPVGSYTITIQGATGSLAHATTVHLTVTAPPAPPAGASFTLSVTPGSRIVKPGKDATVKVTVRSAESRDVEFSVSGLPDGMTFVFAPAEKPGVWELRLSAPASAARFKTYDVTITATVGSVTRTATLTLIVL